MTNGATTRFAYDAFGRRVEKEGPSGTTQYVYQGDHVALELDGQQDVTARYTWFPGVDRPHSVIRGGQTYYYARGATNSVVGLFDDSGQPVSRYRYGPWGEAELAVEGAENALRYTGRRWDASTGLYHNRARYYDPDIARFISQDPLGLGAGLNPYAYAGNDPVNAFDPSGLFCLDLSITAPAGFGVGIVVARVTFFCTVPGVSNAPVGDGTAGGGRGGTNAVFAPRGPVRGPATRGMVGNYVEAGVVGGGSLQGDRPDIGEIAEARCRGDIYQATGNAVLALSGLKTAKAALSGIFHFGKTALTNYGLKRKGLPLAGRFIGDNLKDMGRVAASGAASKAVGSTIGAGFNSALDPNDDFSLLDLVPGVGTYEAITEAIDSCDPG